MSAKPIDISQLTWRKSSHSGQEGGSCVEIADALHAKLCRDSKNPNRPALSFSRGEWNSFVAEIKTGRFGCA
jgi:hypothetical protein